MSYRRLFVESVAGLDEEQMATVRAALRLAGRSHADVPIRTLEIGASGQYVLLGLGDQAFVIETGDQWRLATHWRTLASTTIMPVPGGEYVSLRTFTRPPAAASCSVVSWLAPDSPVIVFPLSRGLSESHDVQYVDELGRAFAVRQKEVVTYDGSGQALSSDPVYEGRVSNSLQGIFRHPNQTRSLYYFATESAICFGRLHSDDRASAIGSD